MSLIENPAEAESVGSREVGGWLHQLVDILDGEVAKIEALGMRGAFDEFFNIRSHIREIASWLDDAKFEIRDPWRLRVAVRDFLKVYDAALVDGPGALDEDVAKLRAAFEPFKGNL